MRIAIVACATHPTLSASNQVFQNALEAEGAEVKVLNWNEHPASAFLSSDLICLRQTWDYQFDPGGFAAWLVGLQAHGANIQPSPHLAIWNNDKRTITELQQEGFETPLTFSSAEQALRSKNDFAQLETVVLKPAFGGDGEGVEMVDVADMASALDALNKKLPGRPFMVQEYLSEIADGEWKMTCIDGKVALAVHAIPPAGEFRTNSRFEPVVTVQEPPDAARAAAEEIMDFVGMPLCGRVDGVMRGDTFICTELELCDPDLHLHHDPDVAQKLAKATIYQL